MPKRLRALRFRTVGPWLYLGRSRRKTETATGANPLRWCFTRRVAHGAHGSGKPERGARDWQTLGDAQASQGARHLAADAEAISWMCPYAVLSHCRSR
jgi:hypothetical protein